MGREGVVTAEPRVLHAITGRVRIHVPEWSGQGKRQIETQLYQIQGIERVQANPATGNILFLFDPTLLDESAIIHAVQTLDLEQMHDQAVEPTLPPVAREKEGKMVRARIAVRGLDRDPHLAKRVVEQLEKHSGVRALANPLTGRVLVEFTEHESELDDLIAEVADLELPDLAGEDRPAYPLDPGPLIQGATRTLGTVLGLGFLATRRLLGREEALPGAGGAAYAAGLISLLYGFSTVRIGLRRVLGPPVADLLFSLPGIAMLTLSSSPLGLAVIGAESLRLLTAVQARRSAWKEHEARIAQTPSAQPDAVLRLESGERIPLAAQIHEGTGTATGIDGMPLPFYPGTLLPPGTRLYGGPFVLQLKGEASFERFTPQSRTAPASPTLYDKYQRLQAYLALAYSGLTALLTRSFSQTFAALLLVNPRTASIGMENADLHANARVLRTGVTIVGTRPDRKVRLPDFVLLDSARLLTERLELANVLPLSDEVEATEALECAAGIANAAGSPWGGIFQVTSLNATDGSFNGTVATALLKERRYTLGPVENWQNWPEAASLRQRGNYILALRREAEERPLAFFALRPRLASGVQTLVSTCQRLGVQLALLSQGDELALHALTHRAQISLLESDSALKVIAEHQEKGELVAFVSDQAGAMAAFSACDLAIGLTDDRSRLPARADLLAPDLAAVAAIIETGSRREATTRDAVGLSVISNLVGIVWGFKSSPAVAIASRAVYITALSALADGWLRLRGGQEARSTVARLVDPHPERWGRRDVDEVLRLLNTTSQGLTGKQVHERRRRKAPTQPGHSPLQTALREQVSSPLTGILASGALLSLLFGSIGDVIIIGATIAANAIVGVWQEHKADQVAEALRHIGTSQTRVLRDNQEKIIPSEELVTGDILLLAAGDRIAADARVIEAHDLEVDEAALTGESFPVPKYASNGNETARILLEGSDVTAGTGRAVVVAVGEQTRLGATRLALMEEKEQLSPLGTRLSRMLRLFLPISAIGGATVVVAGLLWKRPLTALLATGATVALAGVPEGLPLLSRVGEAGVARRLARHKAVVRRLSSVEALGRVDVVGTDKTGTMTRGRLQLSVVADANQEAPVTENLPEPLARVLFTAALASPHPDAQGAQAHPTDVAVIQGARAAGLEAQTGLTREAELSFDPARSFYVTIVQGRLCIKGAPEVLLSRCSSVLQDGEEQPLDEARRALLLTRSQQLAARGLRVLMVAEGSKDLPLDDPEHLTALGFVGIHDPLRPTVQKAVKRCQEAGVRVIMITGDHPATARAIALEAGLLTGQEEVLNAAEIADLQNGDLDQRLQHATVIARATPLDKLRIVESLRRQGHAVAMTGDGVNDAPALRLADIGVAMGQSGTEVARQTADVVIADDDFSTLVEGFVEGRSFWRNIRRSLGLLLGGNLGELGLVVGASLLGASIPLTVGQILAVNAITDILPALAVILQQPEYHDLTRLQREGASALDAPLFYEVLRRGLATALPSLAAYLITLGTGTLPQARSVAFVSIVVNQLAQTLMAGRAEGHLTRPVVGAVGGSLGVLLAAFSIPPLRQFLSLALLAPSAWLLMAGSALAALLLNRLLTEIARRTHTQNAIAEHSSTKLLEEQGYSVA